MNKKTIFGPRRIKKIYRKGTRKSQRKFTFIFPDIAKWSEG